jgi:hypothetical protein
MVLHVNPHKHLMDFLLATFIVDCFLEIGIVILFFHFLFQFTGGPSWDPNSKRGVGLGLESLESF